MNLNTMAQAISPAIPRDAWIIDVGGGDGEPLNNLLALRSDIKVTMIDLRMNIGGAIKQEFIHRVKKHPGVGMAQFKNNSERAPDVVLISDVVHHVPAKDRKEFFSDLLVLARSKKDTRIIIKDIEPGYFRAFLGRIADRWISGDKEMSLVSRDALLRLMYETFGTAFETKETALFKMDPPNYAQVFVIHSV
jgi:2-polyprenyl-3-methyl-5-hydroxy-6-metoxy-1,4-benzoquinol methylase